MLRKNGHIMRSSLSGHMIKGSASTCSCCAGCDDACCDHYVVTVTGNGAPYDGTYDVYRIACAYTWATADYDAGTGDGTLFLDTATHDSMRLALGNISELDGNQFASIPHDTGDVDCPSSQPAEPDPDHDTYFCPDFRCWGSADSGVEITCAD